MGAFPTLFTLLVLVGSAWGGCQQSDWQDILDRNNVWAVCSNKEYINGFWRNDNGGAGDERLGRIEFTKCCSPPASYANSNEYCLNANWWGVWDSNNRWAECPNGRYLQGIYKSDDKWLHNVEEGKCCKPSGHPSAWGHCYEQDVGLSFDNRGWSNCNDDYYLVGLWRGTCDKLYCIEKFKCCKMQEKVINGGWSEYGAWGSCSKSCGGGTQSRSRTCTNPRPANGGAQCSGEISESQDCNIKACPVDGGWGDFGEWGSCSKTCGGGVQTRSRSCNNPAPAYGGAKCSGDADETQACSENPCEVKRVNGGWSKWSAFGECNKKCGKGKRYKTRSCTNPPPSGGGKKCKGKNKKGKKCNAGRC